MLYNFKIGQEIGKGEFSVVYKAQCDGKRVALKKIRIVDKENSKAITECKTEINLFQKLDHPCLIKCFDSFIYEKELYIVLELADEEDLSTTIKSFKEKKLLIPEKIIWKYFLQVCGAVRHMHLNKVMHRDIKPENVFLTRDGNIKLGDLNTGRFFSSGATPSQSLAPPENIKGHIYGFKSDIWYLGCLLYEMAALQPPFYEEKLSFPELIKKIEERVYPPIPSDYTIPMRKLVADCLNPDPEERLNIEFVHTTALGFCYA